MKRITTWLCAAMLMTASLSSAAVEVVTIRSDLPSTAPRLNIALQCAAAPASELQQIASMVAVAPADTRKDKALGVEEFPWKVELGSVAAERYVAYFREETKLPWLGNRQQNVFKVRGYCLRKGRAKPEQVFEGLIASNEMPRIEVRKEPPAATGLPPYSVLISLSLNRSGNDKVPYSATAGMATTLRACGSTTFEQVGIQACVQNITEAGVSAPGANWRATISRPKMPPAVSEAPLTSNIDCAGVVIALEKVAADFSSATIAVLGTAPVETPEALKQLPKFARVDLLRRATVTQDDLLSAAQNSAGIVLIATGTMGERQQWNPFPGTGDCLSMDEMAAYEKVAGNLRTPPIVCFTARAVPAALLFEKYVDKVPPFYLLSDPSDPACVSVLPRAGMNCCYGGGGGGGRVAPPSYLSNALGDVRSETVVAAFDRNGKLLLKRSTRDAALQDILDEVRGALTK
jgi:hypothetical protein